jgi:cell division protein FtsQ
VRKVKNIFYWFIALAYLGIAIFLTSSEKANMRCSEVEIIVKDSLENYFVRTSDIDKIIRNKGFNLRNQIIDSINIDKLEATIRNHPSVKTAEVYKTISGKITIEITQRKPIVRVVNYNGESYYIDEDARIMPLSKNYTAHVLVVSGNINEPYARFKNSYILDFESVDELNRSTILDDIYLLATHIRSEKLWKTLFEQAFVNENSEFELIPKVGAYYIVLGKIDLLETKLENLKLLYTRGLNKKGWNKYKQINLKYRGQVVCTKR